MKECPNTNMEWRKAQGQEARAMLFSLACIFERQARPFCPLCSQQRVCYSSTERAARKKINRAENNYCLWCPACLIWVRISLPMDL